MAFEPAYGDSGYDYDFNFYNAAGSVWNGAAYVAWNDANYAAYRIAATETGASGRFPVPTPPSDATRYEFRFRGASLALSGVEWTGVDASASTGSGLDIDGYNLEQSMRLQLAALCGAITGGGTGTNEIKAADGSKTRITATYDEYGNRTITDVDVS